MRIFREDRTQIFYRNTDRNRSDNAFVNILQNVRKKAHKIFIRSKAFK